MQINRCISFRNSDLQGFAALCGDYNPLHVDPITARRTIAGDQTVHGMFQLLTVLNMFLHKCAGRLSISKVKIAFAKPLLVDQSIMFTFDQSSERCFFVGKVNNQTITKGFFDVGPYVSPRQTPLPGLCAQQKQIRDIGVNELVGMKGTIDLGIDVERCLAFFPHVTDTLGIDGTAGLLALSRLVGMECPGLHSLFAQAEVDFIEGDEMTSFDYQVVEVDKRFSRAVISVNGSRMRTEVVAFVRPAPAQQASIERVSSVVQSGSFKDRRVLVIGGSRGLGEIASKILAAGGAQVVISYSQGKADANRIVCEITEWGGTCQAIHFDVTTPSEGISRILEHEIYDSLYYFATPNLSVRGFFDHEKLDLFNLFYVTSFGKILDATLSRKADLKVFYPSSVAVDESMRPREFQEYALSKQLGEELCRCYSRFNARCKILVKRLPRLRTDLTGSLVEDESEDGLNVILPMINDLENG